MNKSPIMTCLDTKLLIDVMEIIQKNGKGTAFIVDSNNKVVGILTDGDIRSLLLNGANLQDTIKNKYNKKFVSAIENESPETIISKINDKIKIIPIISKEGQYITYFELQQRAYLPVASPDLQGNELKYLTDAFLSTWISSTGKYIEQFEKDFSHFCQTKYGVATSNGTTALHLALLALDIKDGDEVIVPDLTFAATINAVLYVNATPVIVDIDKESWCIDPEKIRSAITKKTKAIIPVHLYGQPCNMSAIMSIAKKHKLYVIEDAAEAHGATFKNKKVGSFGDIACFSFYGNKVITTGEGGMCVTNSKKLSDKMKKLRDHGMSKTKRYWHDVVGYNYRMTNLQAAIGLAQLERIEEILISRKAVEDKYISILSEIPFINFQQQNLKYCKKITWLVSATVPINIRSKFMAELKSAGIDSRPFFYTLSEMPIYKKYAHKTPVSKHLSRSGINFPTGSNNQINEDSILKIKKISKKFI